MKLHLRFINRALIGNVFSSNTTHTLSFLGFTPFLMKLCKVIPYLFGHFLLQNQHLKLLAAILFNRGGYRPARLNSVHVFWRMMWEVEMAKFLHFHIVGKLTSYQFYCYTMFQIWVIKQKTTWVREKLPCSSVLKKKRVPHVKYTAASLNDNPKPNAPMCLMLISWLISTV